MSVTFYVLKAPPARPEKFAGPETDNNRFLAWVYAQNHADETGDLIRLSAYDETTKRLVPDETAFFQRDRRPLWGRYRGRN